MHLTMTHGRCLALLSLEEISLLFELQTPMTPGPPTRVMVRVLWWKWVRKTLLPVRLVCTTPMVMAWFRWALRVMRILVTLL